MTVTDERPPGAPSGGIFSVLGLAGHPKALRALFFAELWERFSYYGMRALLVLFMVAPAAEGGLGMSAAEAALVYGNYTMAVYLLSIPGGVAADRILGAKPAVLIGGALIATGHFTLAIAHPWTLYAGLILVALGTGLFKPNIGVLVGDLYGPHDTRRDAGFSLFYMGINIGGFFAPLVTGFLAQSPAMKAWLAARGFDPIASWHWGFAAAGVGMVIGLAVLVGGRGLPASDAQPAPLIDQSTERRLLGPFVALAAVTVGTLVLMGLILLSDRPGFEFLRWAYVLVPAALALWLSFSSQDEARRYGAMFVLLIGAMIFWAIFEQAGVTIALFADQLTRSEVAGWAFPSAWFQSLNPLFVILLAPLFAALWMKLGDSQPSSPVKFGLGLVLLALSFLLMAPAALYAAEGRVSPFWLVGLFFLQTTGELLLSPVGLSTMTRLAPARTVGLALGIWFLGAALGNKLAGVFATSFQADEPKALAASFLWQAGLAGLAAVAFFVLTPWIKRLMGSVR
jgi:POT family proton-dependent oligopeptide transporter